MAFLPGGSHGAGRTVDPNLLVGPETHDDAGVYRLSDDLALVQTVDIITPIVDDARRFGRVAAANSLSDVWAMGGRVTTAMNIACFPTDLVPPEVLGQILAGGADACAEAGCAVVGGHTIEDDQLKFGLSVTGTVDPRKTIVNTLAKPGDVLVLTKPLGTGIVNTAAKAGKASPEDIEATIVSMETLNKAAGEAAVAAGVRAGTDVTGFGLVGHSMNIARGSNVTLEYDAAKIPVLPGAQAYAKKGLCTGGAKTNEAYFRNDVSIVASFADIAWDPQTSGGLLLAIPEARLGDLLHELEIRGVAIRAVVGRVVAPGPKRIVIR